MRDSVPLGPDAKTVKVVLRRPAGLAEAKDKGVSVDGAEVRWVRGGQGKGGEELGQIEWEAKVESGAEVKLELEYEVRGPADMYWNLRTEG